MNYLLGLMIIYMVYIILALILSGFRIISPSVIFSTSFTFMLVLAYIFKDKLEFCASILTFKIFITGGFLFLFSESLVRLYYGNKYRLYEGETVYEKIYINKQIQNIFLICMVNSLVISVGVLFINTSGGNFSDRMNQYKEMLLYSKDIVHYRTIVSFLYKINTGISYFCAYILVYNFSVEKVKLRNMNRLVFIIFIFCIFSTISQGARQPLIEMLIYMPIVYVSIHMRNIDKKKIYRMIKKMIPLLGVAVLFFYYSSTLVGRRKTKRGIFEYLAVYLCGGLYSFNLHVNEPARNIYWGQSSFADVYHWLIKLGIVPETANMQYHTFDLYGNTVTLFGRWYEDFGQIGVYTMSVLVSLFFSIMLYKKLVPSANINKENHLARILYCKFIISLVWAGYDDRIRALFSMQTIIFLVTEYFLWWFCVKRNFRLKIR